MAKVTPLGCPLLAAWSGGRPKAETEIQFFSCSHFYLLFLVLCPILVAPILKIDLLWNLFEMFWMHQPPPSACPCPAGRRPCRKEPGRNWQTGTENTLIRKFLEIYFSWRKKEKIFKDKRETFCMLPKIQKLFRIWCQMYTREDICTKKNSFYIADFFFECRPLGTYSRPYLCYFHHTCI